MSLGRDETPSRESGKCQHKQMKKYTYTSQRAIRAAFWESHPEHEAYALKWEIKTAPHNRHNTETRTAFCDFVDSLQRSGQISENLAFRVTL